MRAPRLIVIFIKVSLQQAVAYRANLAIEVLHALLNLGTGIVGLIVLYEQVQQIRGWDFPAALALLGVYLIVGAVRRLFIGPSFDMLAGLNGDVWSGRLDFTLLKPVDTQFLASFRRWEFLALFDLLLGCGVVIIAIGQMLDMPGFIAISAFLVMLVVVILILYAILLTFTALIFWAPGILFTWLFDAIFQMARYPLGMYPGWVRFLLTWIVPVGVMTTVPAQALSSQLQIQTIVATLVLALIMLLASSALFRFGLRRYESASS